MRPRTRGIALIVFIGTLAAAGTWRVRESVVGGRPAPDRALRGLEGLIPEIEAGRRATPIVGELTSTGEAPVTFLAKRVGGQVPRVVSDVTGWGEHIDGTFDFAVGTMTRVADTDWFSLQTIVAPRARIEYQIAYGQTDYRLDPHNPRRSAGPEVGGAAASEFVTAGYVPPQEFEAPRFSPAGAVSEAALEGPCKVMVYRPPGHSNASRYPVAVFLDLRSGPLSRVLDWLIARQDIPPIVAAFVGPASLGDEQCSGAPLATFVAGRLLTWLASRHDVTTSAGGHAILAISYRAKDALDIALGTPGGFGRLGLLIPGRRISRADIAAIAENRDSRLRVAILAGRYDQANLPTARGVQQALADAGHVVSYTEVPEGHSAVTWRNHLGEVLVSLFGGRNAGLSAETSHALPRLLDVK
jgi:enterochelin esterase-like enzyme